MTLTDQRTPPASSASREKTSLRHGNPYERLDRGAFTCGHGETVTSR
ncbi:hypothetical protein AKJ09_02419 [Labilithrix luteola]|uniref:Uncharacterized protein n=1 Tax=Labilithrix luteola TaxID=1391654 RepID=A0A0K1PQD9_9BACT|nr:hypothetical protein AKJ09_02419 [Labilithrix luteola]